MKQNRTLDISWRTIFKVVIALSGLYIIYRTREILIGFFFALVISILFEPAIQFLQRFKIPRVVAVVLTYGSVFLILGALVYYSSSLFVAEIQEFSRLLPQYFEKIAPPLRSLGFEAFESIEKFIQILQRTVGQASENIFKALFLVFGGALSTIFILAVAVTISLEENPALGFLTWIASDQYQNYVRSFFQRSQQRISGWFLARIISCLFVGLSSLSVFLLFDVEYPFTLGLLAAVLEFIPTIGPVITSVLAFVIVFLESPARALFVAVFLILIQQIEGNILTPLLTGRLVGLSPALVLLALVLGGKLWGPLGAVLSVPVVGIGIEFAKEFLEKTR